MRSVSQLVRQSKPTLEQLFGIADAAKNAGRLDIANLLFAYLFDAHRLGVSGLRIQYEYSPQDDEERRDAPWREGDPREQDWAKSPECITQDEIYTSQFNALVVIFMGDKTNPERYLCIPAPMLSTKALRHAFKFAEREGGFVPRRWHNREVDYTKADSFAWTIDELNDLFPSPKWVFGND